MAYNLLFLLNGKVQKEPNIIINFIAKILGTVLNVIYNFVSNFTLEHGLGISIILFTIVIRTFMIPLAVKSQKSMIKTQKIQPEVEKINKKYGNSNDPEVLQKKQKDIQTLYAKEGVNPMSGCLPLFIQLPIFFALSYIMQHSYLYITSLQDLYVDKLATSIIGIEGSLPLISPFVADKLINFGLDISQPDQLARAISKFTDIDWQNFLALIPTEFAAQVAQIQGYLSEKSLIDTFFGLNLTDTAGISFPKIMIPILAALTTFLSSYIMTKQQKKSQTYVDPTVENTQKYTMYIMPIMMGFFTISTPVGVGLYWITNNVYHLVQQIVMNKIFAVKKENE